MVTTRNPTSKSHSAVEEFKNSRDAKLPWDHPFLYLLITPAVIPFGLCATLHCYYMINSLQLQLPNTVQRTFSFFFSSVHHVEKPNCSSKFFPSLCSFTSHVHSHFKSIKRLYSNPLKSLLWDHTKFHLVWALDKLSCP